MFRKIISTIIVIIAGETIFMLPFLIPRLLRPLMIESWGVSNTAIGLAFSAYGFTALISYLIGGPIADKFSPKKLISISLFITALGGFILLNNPTEFIFIIVYGYFGFSTTMLMWSSLIKFTHHLGGGDKRARSMGLLDSGRGLIAAIVSTILIWLLSTLTKSNSSEKIQIAYVFVISFTFLMSILVAFLLQDVKEKAISSDKNKSTWSFSKVLQVLTNKQVWLLSIVILSSYCGYKNIDNYSIYFVDVLGQDSSQSSFYTSLIFWMRPLGAILSGFCVDWFYLRYPQSRFFSLAILLIIACLSQVFLIFSGPLEGVFYFILSIIIFSSLFIYALRAIYFAVFDDMKIPSSVLGTTIGIVSVIGFLPDFFFGSFTGYLIDSNPGVLGFQQVFVFVATILFIGALASFWCWRIVHKTNKAS